MKILICGLLAALAAAKPMNSGNLWSPKTATCCKEKEITIRNNQIMMDNVIYMFQANHAAAMPDTNFSTYNVTFTFFPTKEYGHNACKLKLEYEELPIGAKVWFSCRNPVTMHIICLSLVAIAFALLCWRMCTACWKCCGTDTRNIRRTIKASKASRNLVELEQTEEQSTQLLEDTSFNNDANAILEVSITADTAVHASVKNDSNLNAMEADSRSYHSNFSFAEEDEDLETLDQEVAEILKAKIKRDALAADNQKMDHNSGSEGSYTDDNGSDEDYTDRSSDDRSYDSYGYDQDSDYSDDSRATVFKSSERERRVISDDNESNESTEKEEAKSSERERRQISDDNGTESNGSIEYEATEHTKQQMANEDSEPSEEQKEDMVAGSQQMDHKPVQSKDHDQ